MKVKTILASKSAKFLFCTVAALSLATYVEAQSQPGQAKVQSVKGSAVFSVPGGTAQPLKQGAILSPGTTVKTGAGSQVDLFLGKSAGVVRLTENTSLTLDKYTLTDTGADTVVDLQMSLPDGTILGNVNKLSGASKYEVKLPNGVAGIRGTKYRISATGYIVVIDGKLYFAHVGPDGKVTLHEIPPLHYFSPVEGVKPLPDTMRAEVLKLIPPFRPGEAGAPATTTLPPVTPSTEPFVSPGTVK